MSYISTGSVFSIIVFFLFIFSSSLHFLSSTGNSFPSTNLTSPLPFLLVSFFFPLVFLPLLPPHVPYHSPPTLFSLASSLSLFLSPLVPVVFLSSSLSPLPPLSPSLSILYYLQKSELTQKGLNEKKKNGYRGRT